MMNGGFGGGMPAVSTAGKQGYNRLVAVDLETGMLAWSLGEAPPAASSRTTTALLRPRNWPTARSSWGRPSR